MERRAILKLESSSGYRKAIIFSTDEVVNINFEHIQSYFIKQEHRRRCIHNAAICLTDLRRQAPERVCGRNNATLLLLHPWPESSHSELICR